MSDNGMVRPCSRPTMAEALRIAFVGIDKNPFHVVGLDGHGAIVLRQKWSRGQVEARFANIPPCLIKMETCVNENIQNVPTVARCHLPNPDRRGPTLPHLRRKPA
jgi:hypothetical protein